MIGINRTTQLALAVRQSAPKRSWSAVGRSAATPASSRCVALYVTSPGAVLLLSRGLQRSPSNCNASLVMPTHHEPGEPDLTIPNHIPFDELMESIYD
jgi:hypothetical protein